MPPITVRASGHGHLIVPAGAIHRPTHRIHWHPVGSIRARVPGDVLAGAWLHSGAHRVVWDGRNAADEAVAGGVYIYQFRGGSWTAAQRMVLAR